MCKWFRENKMILNTEKCKALVLARKPNAGGLLKVLPYHQLLYSGIYVWVNIGRFPEFCKNTLEKLALKKVEKQPGVVGRIEYMYTL